MDCSAEENEIRQALEGFAGVRRLGFQLGARTLSIDAPEGDMPDILAAIRKAGFNPEPVSTSTDADEAIAKSHGFAGGIARLIAALVLAGIAEAISYFAPDVLAWKVTGMAIAAAAIWFAGLETYQKGLKALVHAKLNINALMTVAVTGAFVIGQWPEAAMVMALYAIAELIEAKAVDRARNAIKGLLALAPESTEMRQADGSWQSVAPKDVPLEAILRVKPGERIALDGTITTGTTAINQAPVTGESIPVDKAVGDPVFAGTVNETGTIEFKVTAAAANTTLARIIHAVEVAQSTRAPTQRFVDRFAAIYTPAVFVMALAVALITPWAMGWIWLAALYKALVLLVIACPCALVISTPVTVVSGLSTAARRGILIKGGTYLEEARKLKAIALDKTGTITEGKPKLIKWQALNPSGDQAQVAYCAAALAGQSDHPVSKAIATGLTPTSLTVTNFKALPGRGVEGEIQGVRYALGNHRLATERKLATPELEALLAEHEKSGHTVTVLMSDNEALAIFAVADTIKESSKEAIAQLKALGITPVMLTGDNAATAAAIAHEAGIGEARGNLLPEDKLAAIQALQKQYGATGMTGDGINDAPALAQADIGFAMGAAGTDTAMEAADVVVMNDDLRRIATTVELSKKTFHVLWQNITIALSIKAVFFVLAVFGSATMWMAVFADMGASLLVVANGLRLLRTKA
jgi:Cd2+/Zn2+-exporting ATPase